MLSLVFCSNLRMVGQTMHALLLTEGQNHVLLWTLDKGQRIIVFPNSSDARIKAGWNTIINFVQRLKILWCRPCLDFNTPIS
jgi:hypothetical protein